MIPSKRNMDRIVAAVAEEWGCGVDDIRRQSNRPNVWRPRRIAIYVIRELTSASYPEIGEYFGQHHTTAMHACREARRELVDDGGLVYAVATAVIHRLSTGT